VWNAVEMANLEKIKVYSGKRVVKSLSNSARREVLSRGGGKVAGVVLKTSPESNSGW